MTENSTGKELSSRTKSWIFYSIIIAIIGIVISVYSISHHIDLKAQGATDAACNINQTFNCDKVAASKYSEIFGIPLGVWGLGYFLAMFALCGLCLFSKKSIKDYLNTYAVSVLIGIVVSVVLAVVSLAMLGAFCTTCIGIYVTTFLQLAGLLYFQSEVPKGFSIQGLTNGGTTALIAVALTILGFRFLVTIPTPKTVDNPTAEEGLVLGSKVQEIVINKSAYSGLGEDYRKGSDDAKVTIVEFADFECPACRTMGETLKKIASEYGDRISVVFKNYPLDQTCNSSIKRKFHEHACNLAILARCAGNFGKFWQFHDFAYSQQKGITTAKAKSMATALGLTDQQIATCLSDKSIKEKLADDVSIANNLGLTGTPTLYINGRKFLGNKGIIDIKSEIDKILQAN